MMMMISCTNNVGIIDMACCMNSITYW